jgi:hypothetical protein
VVFTAGDQQLLGLFEDVGVDEGRVVVVSGVPGAAEVDLAEVDPVAEHGQDALAAPQVTGFGAMASLVELRGYGFGAQSLACVQVEDGRDEGASVGTGRSLLVAGSGS